MKSYNNLIFLHIPKNGGNTLHSVLNKIYNPKNTFNIEVINNTRLNTDEFINLNEKERTQIKLLKGHMLFGLHKYLIGKTNYITLLRKPEDRIVSFYYYVKNRPNHRLYHFIKDNNYSLYDFVVNIDQGDVHNAQIRWISGLIDSNNEADMLEKALENINSHFAFVGLVEKFDASLICLSNTYQWGIPYYQMQNKGQYKKNVLDEKTLIAIRERNQGDIKLYNLIEKQFNQQFNSKYANYFKLWQLYLVNYFKSLKSPMVLLKKLKKRTINRLRLIFKS